MGPGGFFNRFEWRVLAPMTTGMPSPGVMASPGSSGETWTPSWAQWSGPTRQGILDLIAKDPTAQWYAANTTFGNGLQCPSYGGCIYSSANGTINSSIRIMPVPVFNVDTFMQNPNGVSPIAIQNLIGLFAERIDGSGPNQQIVVRIVPAPGFVAGCPPGVSSCTIVSTASFLRAIVLVR